MSLVIAPTAYLYLETRDDQKRLQDQIIDAIRSQQIWELKNATVAYLNLEGDIDFQNSDGSTPCMLAASVGFLEAVAFFLSFKASLTKTNNYGYTVAHFAAYSKNRELIDFLQKKGADFGQLSFYGCTPQLTARQINNREMSAYLKEVHRLACAYSKELLSRKRLAHILEISGKTELAHPSLNRIDRVMQSLEGWHALDFWNTLAKRTKAFFDLKKDSLPAGIQAELVVELCIEAAKNKPYEQLQRYSEKKPICFNYGFNEHHSVILLWGGFAVICDRGMLEDSFFLLNVDPKKINQDLIKQITALKSANKQEYRTHIFEIFKPYCKAEQIPIFPILNKLLRIPRQKIGNCSWANSEGAIFAFLVLQSVRHYACLPKEQHITVEEIIKTQEGLFTEFRQFVVRYEVDKYLTRHLDKKPKNKPYYPPEDKLLQLMRPKLPGDLTLKIDQLLER